MNISDAPLYTSHCWVGRVSFGGATSQPTTASPTTATKPPPAALSHFTPSGFSVEKCEVLQRESQNLQQQVQAHINFTSQINELKEVSDCLKSLKGIPPF
jgi:hypothetical protein